MNTALHPYEGDRDAQVIGNFRDSDDKVGELDEYGIDVGILEPSLFSTLSSITNSQLAVALANAYNSFVLDGFDAVGDRVKLSMLVAPQQPGEAASEIDDRAAEDAFVKVLLPGTGMVPPPGDERYNPIYEAAADHDFDTPEELYDRIQGHLDHEDVERVMGGNVADLYGLS